MDPTLLAQFYVLLPFLTIILQAALLVVVLIGSMVIARRLKAIQRLLQAERAVKPTIPR